MTLFYIFIVLFLLLAALFVMQPLWSGRSQANEQVNRVAVNAALFKDHLREIDSSLQQERIDQATYDTLKLELQRNLLEDNQQSKALSLTRSTLTASSFWLIALVVFPLTAMAIYWHFGGLQEWQIQQQLDNRLALFERAKTSKIDLRPEFIVNERQLQKDLQSYLSRHPDDLRTYRLLAEVSRGLGDSATAEKSYRHILAVLDTASEEIITDLAQVLWDTRSEQAGEKQTSNLVEIKSLLTTAIEINPNYHAALRLRGVVFLADKQPQQTLAYWRKALINLPPKSPAAMQLFESITALEAALDKVMPKAKANNMTSQVEGAAEAALRVEVSLAEAAEAKPDQTVFIYARAWQGSKMPLAIARVKASELPLTVTLTDSMAMRADLKLSQFESVELVARLSVSGQPQATAGDWQASKGPVSVLDNSSLHQLRIDTPMK